MRWFLSLFLGLSCPAFAKIVPVPYAELEQELSNKLTFETLPQRAEPGFNLDHPFRSTGAWLGEHFAGQSITESVIAGGTPHDALGHAYGHRPIAIRPGATRQNLSIAYHRGFGSNAVLPLGPHGFDDISGRGEGALAVLFDHDQRAVGFKVHTGYAKPLGGEPAEGDVTVHFFTRQGYPMGTQIVTPPRGVAAYGFRVVEGPAIGGILITNTDPGGIALDDILFQIELMLF